MAVRRHSPRPQNAESVLPQQRYVEWRHQKAEYGTRRCAVSPGTRRSATIRLNCVRGSLNGISKRGDNILDSSYVAATPADFAASQNRNDPSSH